MNKKGKVALKKVQIAFSHAIIRRDRICRIRDYEPCYGRCECSHFFTQGSSPSLRFYPNNAFCQCTKHHWNHHNKVSSANVYSNFLLENLDNDELEFMQRARYKFIHYTNDLKLEIIKLCNEDRLDELKNLLKSLLEGTA